jgi:hypothetical protein
VNAPVRGCPVWPVDVYVPVSIPFVMVAVPLDSHPPGQTVNVNRKVASFPDGDPLSGPDADCPFWTMVTVPVNEDAALEVMSQVIVPGPSSS